MNLNLLCLLELMFIVHKKKISAHAQIQSLVRFIKIVFHDLSYQMSDHPGISHIYHYICANLAGITKFLFSILYENIISDQNSRAQLFKHR